MSSIKVERKNMKCATTMKTKSVEDAIDFGMNMKVDLNLLPLSPYLLWDTVCKSMSDTLDLTPPVQTPMELILG